ncbi:hypothetical protein BgiBS90_008674, partial [Biomphalaria glabrata]
GMTRLKIQRDCFCRSKCHSSEGISSGKTVLVRNDHLVEALMYFLYTATPVKGSPVERRSLLEMIIL